MTDVDRLRTLFKGAEDYYGVWITKPKANSSGKVEVEHRKAEGKVTRELWEDHVNGIRPLGIYTIFDEKWCQWGCIDVDISPPPTASVLSIIKEKDYPLSICESKSGRIHIYLFMEKPVLAKKMRIWLKLLASKLKLGQLKKKDFFPAQDQVYNVGNFVNMPFYGNTRLGIGSNGEELNLHEFLKRVRLAKADNLEKALMVATEELSPEAPPCLLSLTEQKSGSGGRNTTLFNIGILYQKMGKSSIEIDERLQNFNQKYCQPPLLHEEVSDIARSLNRNGYKGYQCEKEPLIDLCDKPTCKMRKYGVGKEAAPIPEITLKYLEEGGGVRYELKFFDIDEFMPCSAEDLPNEPKFRVKFFNTYNRTFPSMKKEDWENYLNLIGQTIEEVAIPEGIRQVDELKEHISQFIKHKPTNDRDEVHDGKAWIDKGFVNIAMASLVEWLVSRKFNVSKTQLVKLLTTLANGDPKYNLNFKNGTIRSRVWVFRIPVLELELNDAFKKDSNEGEPL